jgi:hypothetical protein
MRRETNLELDPEFSVLQAVILSSWLGFVDLTAGPVERLETVEWLIVKAGFFGTLSCRR